MSAGNSNFGFSGGGGIIGGGGTLNYIAMFGTDGISIEDSVMYQSSGNVGVGTTSPTARLHTKAVDDTSANYATKIENSSGVPLFAVRNDGYCLLGSNTAGSGVTNILSLGGLYGSTRGSASNIKLQTYNDNTGNIWGLGASSDGSTFGSFELHVANVYGDFAFYQGGQYCFWLKTEGATGGTYGAYIRRQISTAGQGAGYFIQLNDSSNAAADYASVNAIITSNTAGSQEGRLAFHTATSGALTEKATILANGNFGIGLTSPSARLHVKGVDSTSSNYAFKAFDSSNNPILQLRNDHLTTLHVGDQQFYIGTNSNTALAATFGIYDVNYGNVLKFDSYYGRLYLGSGATTFNDSATLNVGTYGLGRYMHFGPDGSRMSITDLAGDGVYIQGKNTTYSRNEFILISDSGLANNNTTAGFLQNAAIGQTSSVNSSTRLFIKGSGTSSSTLALRITNSAYTDLLNVGDDGNVAIGFLSPTARLHLPAGTATASTAPLKFTSGTNLTSAEAGAMEWNGTQLYLTSSTPTRNIIAQVSGATALTSNYVPYATTNGFLTGSSNLTFNGTKLVIANPANSANFELGAFKFGIDTTGASYVLTAGNFLKVLNTAGSAYLALFSSSYAAINTKLMIGGITLPTAQLHLTAGTATASTAPLKFNSGTLLTTAEAGAVEFLTDKFYGTITTSAARKEFTLNDAALTSGRIPFATTNGRLTDTSNLLWDNSSSLLGVAVTPTSTLHSGGSLGLKVTASSAGSLTLNAGTSIYVFTGTTTTWTLPVISGNTDRIYHIKNRGSGAITLQSNDGVSNEIYDSAATNSVTIAAGASAIISNDGTYWLVM